MRLTNFDDMSLLAASASATPNPNAIPPQYRSVGVCLAVASGVLIGSSFVFKKKGLLQSQAGGTAGEGVAYLKNPLWWTGMTMMICGELCNFGAYAFVEAIIVTPLGALSVVICAILSSIFLKEKLSLFGWIGCFQCIVGSVIVALNGPEEQSVSTIEEFKHLFLAPGFLAFGSVVICSSLVIIFFFAPKYGKQSMLWYISVCSLIGGLSVSCTQGLGASIVTSIRGENQFKNWFIYFLLIFVIITLLTEIYYLNMALALFNTAMVTPTYYVIFTGCTLVTSVVLYQGLKASAVQIITVVLGFLIICSGITILQISKVEPTKLRGLDRRTTMLLQAAREEAEPYDQQDPEKAAIEASEEPGVDALQARLGGGIGTIIRARRRASTLGDRSTVHRNSMSTYGGDEAAHERENVAGRGVRRFQLHDAPMPMSPAKSTRSLNPLRSMRGKKSRDSSASAVAVRGSIGVNDYAFPPPPSNDNDLSIPTLLAQQRWAEGAHDDSNNITNGSTPTPRASADPENDDHPLPPRLQLRQPEASHPRPTAMIHFASRVERSQGSIPPISETPPIRSPNGSGTSSPTPRVLTPNGKMISSPMPLSPNGNNTTNGLRSMYSLGGSSRSSPSPSPTPRLREEPLIEESEEEEEEEEGGKTPRDVHEREDDLLSIPPPRSELRDSAPPSRKPSGSSSRSIPSTDQSGARRLLDERTD